MRWGEYGCGTSVEDVLHWTCSGGGVVPPDLTAEREVQTGAGR
jgi:hypothetical protein